MDEVVLKRNRDLVANGYLLVRGPVCTESGCYWGVDREPWGTIGDHYWTHQLPPNLAAVFERLRRRENRGVWWPFAPNLDDVFALHEYARQHDPDTEIIATYSDYLEHSIGAPRTEVAGCHLGFDVVSVGEWSLLRELLESSIALPSDIAKGVNAKGLLTDASIALAVEKFYRKVAQPRGAEVIASDPRIPVEAVSVIGVDLESYKRQEES